MKRMIALLDTSEDLLVCRKELGCPVEQLLTPLTMFKRQNHRAKFAIDNGAFAGFKPGPFKGLLLREKDAQSLCRFVAVPDVVGSARRTIEVFDHWKYKLSGWPLALVVQDGIEDLDIPWAQIAAIFIGGSTKFKLSKAAADVVSAAQAIGKWIHAGRVNAPARYEYFEEMGVDSIDGTGLSRYSHMREEIWRAHNQPNLLTDLAPSVEDSFLREQTASATAETVSAITAVCTNGADALPNLGVLAKQADHEQASQWVVGPESP